jgi:hypothetical protein
MFEVGRKRFFFEKKKQKTFDYGGHWRRCCQSPQRIGVFLLLFLQKKKRLLSFPNQAARESA